MNHRPRQPGNTPSQHGAQQRPNHPAQHPPQHPGFNGYRPPNAPQQQPPIQNGVPQNGTQMPRQASNQANGQRNPNQPPQPFLSNPQMNGRPHPQQPAPQSKLSDTDFGLPQHPQKPIPASVPSVDLDAISSALDQCATELDAMERAGHIPPSNPDRLDDLVEIDMYTPKEQIPMAKRHMAAQKVAFRGPAEEGQGQKELDLINALRIPSPNSGAIQNIPPNPMQPSMQPGGEALNGLAPERKIPQPSKNAASAVTEGMLEAFEAAIFDDAPAKPQQTPLQPAQKAELKQEPEPNAVQPDAFSSRLMPENNAYKVERDENAAGLDDTGMTIEDLHNFYAAQKGEPTKEERAAQEAFLSQKAETSAPSSGFLQGLGSGNAKPTPVFSPDQLPVAGNLATSGGFLAGLDNGGADQLSAVSSRSIFPGLEETPKPSGSSFLDSLSSMKPPQEEAPQFGLPVHHQPSGPAHQPQPAPPGFTPEPGFDEIWNSNHISPAAKAYRDTVLYGAPEQPVQQQLQPEQHPVMHPPMMQEPMQNLAPQQQPSTLMPPPATHPGPAPEQRPAFLDKPAPLQTIMEEAEAKQQTPPSARKVRKPRKDKPSAEERKKRRAIKNYFGDKPIWSLLTAFIGLGVMASQYRYDPLREWVKPELTWYLVAGGALFLVSILWRYFRFRKPSEDKLDDWIAEDLVGLEKRALEQLQLNNRYLLLEPVIMASFPDLDNIDKEHVYGLYGRDHILRYTPRAIIVMCFTRDEVLTYEGAIDLTTGEIAYESTREFFYADVATIGMVKSKVKNRIRWKNVIRPWRWSIVERFIRFISGQSIDKAASKTRESFIINLKSGSQIQLILRDGRILRDRAYEEVPLSTDEKVLKAITDFVVAQKTDQLSAYR